MKLLQPLIRRGLLQNVPEGIKAPFRRVVRPEQLYDPVLLKLGLDVIKPTDVFLSSYPKSGNTWLRFLIGNLLHEEEEVSFQNIDQYVPNPEIGSAAAWLNKLERRPVMKTHWHFFDRFPKFIYIYRDPRDTMISLYHYVSKNDPEQVQGDLSHYIRTVDKYVDWGTHVESALTEQAKRKQDVCMLQYEHMLEHPHEGLDQVARFLGLNRTPAQIEKTVEKCSFSTLQKVEQKHGPERGNAGAERASGFFRVGKARQWETRMSLEDREWIWSRFGTVMAKTGYERG